MTRNYQFNHKHMMLYYTVELKTKDLNYFIL